MDDDSFTLLVDVYRALLKGQYLTGIAYAEWPICEAVLNYMLERGLISCFMVNNKVYVGLVPKESKK